VGIYTDQVLDSYKGKNRLEVRHTASNWRPELTKAGPPACLRHRRVLILQHERIQGKPVRNHFGRVWSRKDRSRKATDAIHCECLGWDQLLDPGDQGHGAGHQSTARVVRKRKDTAEQQFLAVRKVPRDSFQCARRACRSQHQQLSSREVESRRPDHERAKFPYLLPVHKGSATAVSRYVETARAPSGFG
jgi:hypothetical protein